MAKRVRDPLWSSAINFRASLLLYLDSTTVLYLVSITVLTPLASGFVFVLLVIFFYLTVASRVQYPVWSPVIKSTASPFLYLVLNTILYPERITVLSPSSSDLLYVVPLLFFTVPSTIPIVKSCNKSYSEPFPLSGIEHYILSQLLNCPHRRVICVYVVPGIFF